MSIVRRIDELGRIVIPKDIRKDLRLLNNDLVEIKVENDLIVVKKKKENDKYIELCNKIINNLYKIIKNNIIITNKDIVLEYKGDKKYNIKNERLTNNIINKIINRNIINEYGNLDITNSLSINKYYIFEPIVIDSNTVGSIIYFKDQEITKEEIKLLELSRLLLENYIEE